jgi:hypothetical protein
MIGLVNDGNVKSFSFPSNGRKNSPLKASKSDGTVKEANNQDVIIVQSKPNSKARKKKRKNHLKKKNKSSTTKALKLKQKAILDEQKTLLIQARELMRRKNKEVKVIRKQQLFEARLLKKDNKKLAIQAQAKLLQEKKEKREQEKQQKIKEKIRKLNQQEYEENFKSVAREAKRLNQILKSYRPKKDKKDINEIALTSSRKLAQKKAGRILNTQFWFYAIKRLSCMAEDDLYRPFEKTLTEDIQTWLYYQYARIEQLTNIELIQLNNCKVFSLYIELSSHRSWMRKYELLKFYLRRYRTYNIQQFEYYDLKLWMKSQWFLGSDLKPLYFEMLDKLHFWTLAFIERQNPHHRKQLSELLSILDQELPVEDLNKHKTVNEIWGIVYPSLCRHHIQTCLFPDLNSNELSEENLEKIEYIRDHKDLLNIDQINKLNAIGFIWKRKNPILTRNVGVDYAKSVIEYL